MKTKNPKSLPVQVDADLRDIFRQFPLASLRHVVANRQRLRKGSYRTPDGGGCLLHLLSEPLPEGRRIDSRESLTRYFTGGSGPGYRERPEYQPARYIVRLIDGLPQDRYDGWTGLTWDAVIGVVEDEIARRRAGSIAFSAAAAG